MIRIHNFTTDSDDSGIYFRYCFQEVLPGNESADLECQWSDCFVNQEPGIRLDFSQEFLLGQSNPIVFRGHTEEWKVSTYNCSNLGRWVNFDRIWPLWLSLVPRLIPTSSHFQCPN